MAKRISSLSVGLGATVAPFVNAFKGPVAGALRSFQSSVMSAGASVIKFTGIGAGISAVVGAIGGLGRGISLAAELEQNAVAFETMLGSADAAKALLTDLQNFASSTPFEFPELADSAKKLAAFGVSTDKIMPSLKAIGDIASGVGAPVSELAEIFGKAKVQGRLMAEDINQLTGRGIPIIQELAKQFGVAESEVKGLVSSGQVGFPNLEKAFMSLTSEGGKFAGMMEKQSGTLSGLWSTMVDSISMTLAGLTQTIFSAFNIKGGLQVAISALSSFGAWLQGMVATYAPVVIAAMQMVYAGIVTAFTAIKNFIMPVVTAIAGYIASNWQAIVATTVGYTLAVYNVVSAVLSAVWSVVQSIWDGIVAVWTWALDLIGVKTDTATSGIGSAFTTLADWGRWLQEKLTFAFNVAAYAINHMGDTFELIGAGLALDVVRLGNQIVYTFTEVIPAVLKWFAENWRDILTTVWNFTSTVFTNMGKNVGNFFKATWSWLKGDGFDFQWTGLLDGFENTIKELPKIAEREIGPLEASLQKNYDDLSQKYGQGLGDYLAEQATKTKDATDAVKDVVKDLTDKAKPPEIEAPKPPTVELPTPTLDINTDPAIAAIDSVKDHASGIALMKSGSAEALNARAKAFADSIRVEADGVAAAPAKSAPPPKAAPVPPRATESARNEASTVELLKQMLTQLVTGNTSLAKIAAADSTPENVATM